MNINLFKRFAGIIILSLIIILGGTGCTSDDGSYIAPLGVLPYSTGDSGTIEGTIKAIVQPGLYFNYTASSTTTDATSEVTTTQELVDEDLLDQYGDSTYEIKIKARIQIAGKTYQYEPDLEDTFYIADIPTGYHTVLIEVPGMKAFQKSIKIDAGVREFDFVIEHPENLKPNFYKNIAQVNVAIDIAEDTTDTEEATLSFEEVQTTRFTDPEISVYIDDSVLTQSGNPEINEEFIEMLGVWENSGINISFKFVNSRSEADISVSWIDNSVNTFTTYLTYNDPENPLRVFKPVLTYPLYIPGTDIIPMSNYRKTIMAREIGRALGLRGYSPRNNDIMYAGEEMILKGQIELSDSDVNTIKMLYDTVPAFDENSYVGFGTEEEE